jgi:hypothetical protein
MSIIDKLKNAHPAYWVIGLGGVALAIDYYVERDRSVASSIYRKLSGAEKNKEGERQGTLRRRVSTPQAAVMLPGSLYQTSRVYYPAFPSVHPYRHWMHGEPIFERGFEHGFGHEDWFGRRHEHDLGRHGREYGSFGHNHAR